MSEFTNMTRDEEIALCERLKTKAALFSSDPAKGYDAGYRPLQRFIPNPDRQLSLDRNPDIPTRSVFLTWLYGVAQKDLAGRRWTILDGEGLADSELVLGRVIK